MEDPDYRFYEMRVERHMTRAVVRADKIQDRLDLLGTRPTGAHLSMYRYTKEILEYKRANVRAGKERTAGYRGAHKSDGLPIEIDVEGGSEKLALTTEVAQSVVRALTEHWGAPYESLSPYYSGNRGYHLIVPLQLFGGLPPHTNVPSALFELAVEVLSAPQTVGLLSAPSGGDLFQSDYVDTQVYSHLHLLRMPGTIHETTGLWKNVARESELFAGAAAVREMASERRRPYRAPMAEVPALLEIGDEIRSRMLEGRLRYRRFERSSGSIKLPISTLGDLADTDLPGFSEFGEESRRVLDLLRTGIRESESEAGTTGRRMRIFKLAGHLYRYGVPPDVAAPLLSLLNHTYDPPLDESEFVDAVRGAYSA